MQDFGSLLRFLRVGPIDGIWFRQRIVKPLDTTKLPVEALRTLRGFVPKICLRRTKTVLQTPLPLNSRRTEYIVLDENERAIYDACRKDARIRMDEAVSRGMDAKSGSVIIRAMTSLRQACNHLDILNDEQRGRILYSIARDTREMPVRCTISSNSNSVSMYDTVGCSADGPDPMDIDTEDSCVDYSKPSTLQPSSKVQALIKNHEAAAHCSDTPVKR